MKAKNELVQYKHFCTKLLYKYLKDGDLASLYLELQIVESNAKKRFGGKDAKLWFTFYDDDPYNTTLEDILRDLSFPFKHQSRQLMVRCFELAVSLEGDLKVYFS